jgi:hypothetical protein
MKLENKLKEWKETALADKAYLGSTLVFHRVFLFPSIELLSQFFCWWLGNSLPSTIDPVFRRSGIQPTGSFNSLLCFHTSPTSDPWESEPSKFLFFIFSVPFSAKAIYWECCDSRWSIHLHPNPTLLSSQKSVTGNSTTTRLGGWGIS